MQKIFVEVTGVAAQQWSQVCVCFFFLGIWPPPFRKMGTKKEGAMRTPSWLAGEPGELPQGFAKALD